MSTIKLTPQFLISDCQKFSYAANELNRINNDIAHLVSSLDWQIRSKGNIETLIDQTAANGRNLANQIDSLSQYLKNCANQFQQVDANGKTTIGETTCKFIPTTGAISGVAAAGFITGLFTGGTRWFQTELGWLKKVLGIGNIGNNTTTQNINNITISSHDMSAINYVLELERLGKENVSNPVPGGIYNGKGNEFDRKEYPTDLPKGHSGIDIQPSDKVNNPNPEILAAFGGKVSKVGYDSDGYGHYVVVDTIVEGKSCQVFYGHLMDRSIKIKEGDMIPGGVEIGKMGTSGASTGVHLHFEIRKYNGDNGNYEPVSPIPILQLASTTKFSNIKL